MKSFFNPLHWLSCLFKAVDRLSRRQQRGVHLLLFFLTGLSIYYIGSTLSQNNSLWYTLGLLAILTAHESAHYLLARYHGVSATLPFFIPLPLPPFGTMGALIRMRSPIPHRRALLDIGAAGPLAGLIVAVPLIVWGIRLSELVPLANMGETTLGLGDSLLFTGLIHWVRGPIPQGFDLLLHPLAYAGWVGVLVTAINLLPIGQLDGGHVIYALFRRRSRYVASAFHAGLVAVFAFYYVGWILPVLVLGFVKGHPPTLEDEQPLNPFRVFLGILTLLCFILCFSPIPFGLGDGLIPLIRKGLGW